MTKNSATVLRYDDRSAHQSIARFGALNTPTGSYELPAMSPGVRTETDAEALLRTMRGGVPVATITPLLSWSNSMGETLWGALRGAGGAARVRPPLVIPDPESEAFSFNCIARSRFAGLRETPALVKALMECSLSGDDGRDETYQHWRTYVAHYGFATFEEWLEEMYISVRSPIFFSVGPIVRASTAKVDQCFSFQRTMLLDQVGKALFPMYGAHFLVHAELFGRTDKSKAALTAFYDNLDALLDADGMPDLFSSFKVWDANSSLLQPEGGSVRLRSLSEFITEVSERVRRHRGALVAHNFGPLGLGGLDSGADVASFRITGPMRIDTPIRRPPSGPRAIPRLMNPATLTEEPVEVLAAQWRSRRALPAPTGVEPGPYWTYPTYNEQVAYTGHQRCATLVELGREYRAAGLDPSIPLSEAVRSRILRSEVKQALLDLCPSMANG